MLRLLSTWLLAAAPAPAQSSLPPELEPLFVKGVQAQKAGQLVEAECAFLKVLQQGGRTSFVYNNLGAVYQQQGNHLRAITRFREALRLQPDYPAPRFLLGASLLALGKTAEAIGELQRALKLDPGQRLGRLQLIKAYELNGNPLAVVEEYRKLQESNPRDSETLYQLGKAYMRLSEWAFAELKRLNPRSPLLYQTLAANYRLQGKDELAIQTLRQAIPLGPAQPELHLSLAEIYLDHGKTAEARAEIEAELHIMPGSRAALELKKKLDAASH